LLDWIRRKNPNLTHEILVGIGQQHLCSNHFRVQRFATLGKQEMVSYLVLEREFQGFETPEGTIWILECGSIMHLGYTITLIIAKTKK